MNNIECNFAPVWCPKSKSTKTTDLNSSDKGLSAQGFQNEAPEELLRKFCKTLSCCVLPRASIMTIGSLIEKNAPRNSVEILLRKGERVSHGTEIENNVQHKQIRFVGNQKKA